jgi:adenylate kinase family enzyme
LPDWIIDGNFLRFQHLILPAADTIIWLDLPRRVCLRRIIWRWFCWRGRTRPDLPDGCLEKIDAEFLAWVWNFARDQRPKLISKLSELRDDQRLITLRSARQVKRFMRELDGSN